MTYRLIRLIAAAALLTNATPAHAETPVSSSDPARMVLAMADISAAPDPDPAGSSAYPASPGSSAEPASPAQRFALFGQSTFTAMGTLGFRDPYDGPQSVSPHELRETFDATLFAGMRPWSGGEIWATLEVDQGFGVGNTHGLAGFPSGEAYKLGQAQPYIRVQRLFWRQTIALGGESTTVEAAANQLAGTQTANRLVLTLGKFSVVDVFDTNKYAHDPRGDMLNWTLIDAGAFDYGGDPWGFTYGGAAELTIGPWTARAGGFALTAVPGGMEVAADFSYFQLVGEIEHRHALGGHPGAVRGAIWANHGRIGRYADAVAWGIANATAPDVSQVQITPRTRLGGYINAEQELTGSLGLFARASHADGRYAAFDFTDVDTSVSAGLSLTGKSWHRADDTVALAAVVNTISKDAQAYFAAGGMGILIGDGVLPRPGAERIIETSYTWRPAKPVAITFDAQVIANPAYNRDRGPVALYGVRLHAAF